MTLSDGDALRRAILAQPDDDIARLVYADWLDENGQSSRAAFVRAQVQSAQAEPYSPDARRWAAAAKRLLDANKGDWTKPLGQRVLRWEFRRGFVEHAEVNVATFPRDAAELFAAEPIRSLQMTRFASPSGTVSLLPFFDTPQLDRVCRLDLTGLHLSPVELEPLAECPRLVTLTDLCLSGLYVPPDWFGAALTGAALPALTGLSLYDLSHLGPCLADALPRCTHRRFLRLDLSHIAFASDGLQKVLDSRCLREVEELRLCWMTGSGRPGPLSHLDLSWGVIPWNRLRLLDLSGQGLGDDGVAQIMQALGRWKDRVPLRWLGLAKNQIGPAAVRALVGSDPEKVHLYHLDVRGNFLALSQLDALHSRFPDAVILSRDV
jgi:uncharacterized protein (TIGR02996 family)